MRICLYTPYFPPVVGGAERQASLLATGLAESGDEVTVVTRHLPGHPAHEVREGVQVHRAIRPGRRGALFGLGLLLTLFAFFARRRGAFDVVHVTGIHLGSYVPCRLRRRSGFRVVLRPMGPSPIGDLATLAGQRFWPLFQGGDAPTLRYLLRTIHEADAIVALNRELIAELVTNGFLQERIARINNGVSIPETAWNASRAQALRHSLGLPGGPLLLYVGRLHPQKGVDDLLRTLPALVRRHPELTLILLGDGPAEADLRALAAELGIAHRARFLGFRDPAPYLQTADIFVLPTWSEGISNALLEAMSIGLPCITTRVSGNIEVITHGEAGFLVEPRQPQALEQAIAASLDDPVLRLKMGRNARQLAREAYSVDRMVADYRSLFTHLVTDGKIPAALSAGLDRAA